MQICVGELFGKMSLKDTVQLRQEMLTHVHGMGRLDLSWYGVHMDRRRLFYTV